MRYKLYENDFNKNYSDVDLTHQILLNRGISNPDEYLNLNDSSLYDYHLLDNIEEAVKCFVAHYEKKNKIGVLVDSDVDGYTSASAMINYIKKTDENYPVEYILHKETKSHGLDGLDRDVVIPEDIKLLIIPDASTNDFKPCSDLIDRGLDIIILDHHLADREGIKNAEQCIIVNNQMSDKYPNKNLSGVGVVYKFLQALDEEMWFEYADDFLDLVALGNIADSMDVRSYETRQLVSDGLSNIMNKAFIGLINAQEYSINGIVNMHTVSWFIAPLINGCIRNGSLKEKELLFRAFIETDEFFENKKRATKNTPAMIVKESIYDRAARLSKNAKSRQDKVRDKVFNKILEMSDTVKDNKVAIFDVTGILENKGLTGVVAMKVADRLNKPCLLVQEGYDKMNNKILAGSGRNINNSPVESLKDTLASTNMFRYVSGHANAFGVGFNYTMLNKINNALNKELKDVEYDSSYTVDLIIKPEDVSFDLCNEVYKLRDYIGNGIDEPLVAVEGLKVNRENCNIFGKTTNTIKIDNGDGITYIQFFCKDGNPIYDWLNDSWSDCNDITVNLVGSPSINSYNGILTPQIAIKDVEIVAKHIPYPDEEEFADIWD